MQRPSAKTQALISLQKSLPAQLSAFLSQQRWFGGKARQIQSTEIADIISLGDEFAGALMLVVHVNYFGGAVDTYTVPVLRSDSNSATHGSNVAVLRANGVQADEEEFFVDALKNEDFLGALLRSIQQQKSFPGEKGNLRAFRTAAFPGKEGAPVNSLRPQPLTGEQSNTSAIYGDRLILKFFRRIEEGTNPELEMGTFLAERAQYANVPQIAGWLEYSKGGKPATQAILQAFVPNQGDAWRYTLNSLARFYEVAVPHSVEELATTPTDLRHAKLAIPEFARPLVEPYAKEAGLLGKRTAELHLALSSDSRDPSFTPEPFTSDFQRGLEKSLVQLTSTIFGLLREKLPSLPLESRDQAQELAAREHEVVRQFQSILSTPIGATRTRIHGDFHLGQVLWTGSDFVIIDFEGEPARPLAERRIKQSPLQDVAGMLRSFDYAACAPLIGAAGEPAAMIQDAVHIDAWADCWVGWISNAFLKEYLDTSGSAPYIPQDPNGVEKLLQLYLLQKAVYELGYELNNRPTWVGIPLKGIAKIISA